MSFDGMNFYWKSWIELAFPTYILLLVVSASNHQSSYAVLCKFAKLVGGKNHSHCIIWHTLIIHVMECGFPMPLFSGKHFVLWIVACHCWSIVYCSSILMVMASLWEDLKMDLTPETVYAPWTIPCPLQVQTPILNWFTSDCAYNCLRRFCCKCIGQSWNYHDAGNCNHCLLPYVSSSQQLTI